MQRVSTWVRGNCKLTNYWELKLMLIANAAAALCILAFL